jgi:fumarate reductase flavoprotein subunit
MKKYKTDIAVVAAGAAGLAAAAQAAETGKSVIVLEKKSRAGGAARLGMGPLAIGSRYQKEQMYDLTVEKAFYMFIKVGAENTPTS